MNGFQKVAHNLYRLIVISVELLLARTLRLSGRSKKGDANGVANRRGRTKWTVRRHPGEPLVLSCVIQYCDIMHFGGLILDKTRNKPALF